MPSPTPAPASRRSLPRRLGLLAASGLISQLPVAAQANPGMSDPDCLRPPAEILASTSSVLIPPEARITPLRVEAAPVSNQASVSAPARTAPEGAPTLLASTAPPVGIIPPQNTVPPVSSAGMEATLPSASNGQQLAQVAAPESFPACTYDPPLPPAAPVIRGLW